jgi:hypothetical protein
MRFREKLLILFIAVVVTLLGFNLIASDAAHFLQETKEAGYEWINSDLSKLDAETHQIPSLSKRT